MRHDLHSKLESTSFETQLHKISTNRLAQMLCHIADIDLSVSHEIVKCGASLSSSTDPPCLKPDNSIWECLEDIFVVLGHVSAIHVLLGDFALHSQTDLWLGKVLFHACEELF